MPVLASEAFEIPHDRFTASGAFNRFCDLDALLYVDPHLLSSSTAPEFAGAYDTLQTHFRNILKLIRASKRHNDTFWVRARQMLTFREVGGVGLGFSKKRDSGSAVGPKLAEALLATASEIVGAGYDDPAIFELAGILQEDFGPDRISDMTISIVLGHVLEFTQRVSRELQIPLTAHSVRGVDVDLPTNPVSGKALLLVPGDILRDIPVAESWSDMDHVAAHNEELRARVNETIGENWRHATEELKKETLRRALLEEPELIADLLDQYKSKPTVSYDFADDPAGEIRWFAFAREMLKRLPPEEKNRDVTCNTVHEVVRRICQHFKRLVEDNNLCELLYAPDGKPLKERAAQRLFYGVADAYCQAANLDLTAESNGGRGPVDFKISKGYDCRVNVEAKLSTNNLVKGFEKQLPIYDAAEQAYSSFLLVVRVHDSGTNLEKLLEASDTRIRKGQRCPEVLVVDGRPRPSASKA
jgi:hypothetical protein